MLNVKLKTGYPSTSLGINYIFFGIVVTLALFSFSLFDAAFSKTLIKKIRYKSHDDKVRIVFDLEGEITYAAKTNDSGLQLRLKQAEINQPDDNVTYKLKDWVIKSIYVKRDGEDIVAWFPLEYPVEHKVFSLKQPDRLVIDLGRKFTKYEKTSKVIDGVDYTYIARGVDSEYVSAHILTADPQKVQVFPALSSRPPSVVESFLQILTPWKKFGKIPFHRQNVSEMTDIYNATAGINGTYFAYTGRPLGVLVINGELISYPLYNRTALIIDEDSNVGVDRVIMSSSVEIAGSGYEITGINEPRENKDVIIFTKYFGAYTRTNRFGYELTVRDGKVVKGQVGNSKIPENGYVISFSPMYIEHLASKVKINDKVNVKIRIMTFSERKKSNIRHVVGGGPRLVKRGRAYVTKNFEKFKSDIARGRAARTAVGVTRDGKILLVTVDGKPRQQSPWNKDGQSSSVGMTLEELAAFMKSIGAVDALNLDGGGSSTMVVHQKIINRPVGSGEKAVGNALLIRPIE